VNMKQLYLKKENVRVHKCDKIEKNDLGNKIIRHNETEKSLLKTPPDENERLLLHELFLQTIDEK
jgi:hypothetical protein